MAREKENQLALQSDPTPLKSHALCGMSVIAELLVRNEVIITS